MKIIHGSLSALLTEVKEAGKVDGVRVAVLLQSTTEGRGVPRYTGWVAVTTPLDWGQWAEWRCLVGRGLAAVGEHGCAVPSWLQVAVEARLVEVRGMVEAAGLLMRDGVLAHDAESFEGTLD
jgi:hypothetical protein